MCVCSLCAQVASLVLEVDAEDDRSFFTRWNDSLRRWLPKEPPTEASKTELVQAATVLVRSKDLLQKLEAMLKDANTPVSESIWHSAQTFVLG